MEEEFLTRLISENDDFDEGNWADDPDDTDDADDDAKDDDDDEEEGVPGEVEEE